MLNKMRPQHDHVLAAAAPVLFAVGANGLHRADSPLRQHLLYVPDARHIRPLMRHRDLAPGRLGLSHNLVALSQVPSHGLFAVHVRPHLQTGQHHLQVAIGPARPNRHHFRLFRL